MADNNKNTHKEETKVPENRDNKHVTKNPTITPRESPEKKRRFLLRSFLNFRVFWGLVILFAAILGIGYITSFIILYFQNR